MAATVSLDNMTFWVPPAVAVPECASQVKQQEQLLSQPEYSSPHVNEEQPHTLGFTGPTTNKPILIPSDTEGGLDIDDTDGDNGCRGVGWHSDDTLLSADALVPSLATASPDDVCYIDAFGCESDNLANNMRRLGTPTDDRLNQDTTETKPPCALPPRRPVTRSISPPHSLVNEKSETQNPTATNTDGDPKLIGNKSVVASDDIPEGSLTQPPSPKGSEEEDLREGRGRAPNADKERTQTHERSNPNFISTPTPGPVPMATMTRKDTRRGWSMHMLKRRKAHKSMARVDSCSREVHREPSHLITASKPKTTSETSSSYDSVVRGDQEYSPPARNSDATEALSESCYTDDDSDHHARKRRKLRRSSTRGKPRQRLHAASPSSRRPPSNDKQDEGDPRAPSATFQEWSLEDATLKRVFIGGQALFQIQFSWNSRMNDHSVADVGSRVGVRTSTPRRSRRALRRAIGHAFTPEEDNLLIGLKENQDRLPWPEIHKRFSGIFPGQRSQGSLQVHYCKLRGRKKTESPVMLPQEDQPTGRPQRSSSNIHYPHEDDSDDLDESDISTEDDDCFPAERVLARAESGDFLVLWSDSTTTWEPRSHFQNQKLLETFEKDYHGYNDGVDVVDTRTAFGVRQYLLHWQGRPADEDSWVPEEMISPDRIDPTPSISRIQLIRPSCTGDNRWLIIARF
ncbi:hypothetical protein DL764_005238 [Monosporascus ibericus]|uniref:Chromo domain-containing protein n=1 Tax=Monosporascus ibericus TaxID=155417 RepID=A0A4Q4TD82_9PEZI|nr:hypothetical protein DL764_005238 [Monosporascus ibericus]